MSKRRGNVAFGNNDDYDIDIEYISKASAGEKPAEEREVIPEINVLGRNVGETREEALKNELSEFAKTSPEAVAAVIKGMFRGES